MRPRSLEDGHRRSWWPARRRSLDSAKECAFGDPCCPCQDGDPCHYVDLPGSPAMRPPDSKEDDG